MAFQLATDVRNAIANAVEDTIGTFPVLESRTGPPPASCASADTGTLLVSIDLPSDWLTSASSGNKVKQGVWSGIAVADGVQGHFRLKSSGGAVKAQGSITLLLGGGDLETNNLSLETGQSVAVNGCTLHAANE